MNSSGSGSIHLDVRRACRSRQDEPQHYHYHHRHHAACCCGTISSSSSNCSRCSCCTSAGCSMLTLSVTGNQVDPVHVERALAYVSCHPGACPPLVRLNLTQTRLYDNDNPTSTNTIIMKRLRQVFAVHKKMLQTVDFSWNHLGHNNNAGLVQVLLAMMGTTSEEESSSSSISSSSSTSTSTSSSIQQLYLYGNEICDTSDLKLLGDLIICKKKKDCTIAIDDEAPVDDRAAAPDATTTPLPGIGSSGGGGNGGGFGFGLRELHLGSNTLLGMHCALSLANGLSHPHGCSLVELDLWCCRLGDDAGAVLIRNGVCQNKIQNNNTDNNNNNNNSSALQVLRLNLNDLSYKSCQALTEMLAVNQTLQVLNLDSNDQLFSCSSSKRKSNINEGDNADDYDEKTHQAMGLAFAQVLGKKNSGLRHLGLPNTGMTDAIAVAMFQNLEHNDTLLYLDIGYNNAIDRAGYVQMIESIPKFVTLQYLRTHARSQIMNVPQLVSTSLRLNTSLIRLTYICVGSVHDQNTMDDYFRRNLCLLQARALVRNCYATTRHVAGAASCTTSTTIRQWPSSPEEQQPPLSSGNADAVPLGLWAMALHKFAKPPTPASASSSALQQKTILPTTTTTAPSTSSTCISALYTLVQGQAPTWIQQYQQAKQEAADAKAASRKQEEEAAAATIQQQQQQDAAEEAKEVQQQQKAAARIHTSTFKIKSRLLSSKRRLL
jgi:hypothetical protein